jgi:hypothetical protein
MQIVNGWIGRWKSNVLYLYLRGIYKIFQMINTMSEIVQQLELIYMHFSPQFIDTISTEEKTPN